MKISLEELIKTDKMIDGYLVPLIRHQQKIVSKANRINEIWEELENQYLDLREQKNELISTLVTQINNSPGKDIDPAIVARCVERILELPRLPSPY